MLFFRYMTQWHQLIFKTVGFDVEYKATMKCATVLKPNQILQLHGEER